MEYNENVVRVNTDGMLVELVQWLSYSDILPNFMDWVFFFFLSTKCFLFSPKCAGKKIRIVYLTSTVSMVCIFLFWFRKSFNIFALTAQAQVLFITAISAQTVSRLFFKRILLFSFHLFILIFFLMNQQCPGQRIIIKFIRRARVYIINDDLQC